MANSNWDDVEQWHFAIAGLKTNTDSLELKPGVHINKLKLVPTETELTTHLKDSLVAGVMQHYCGDQVIQHELVIDATLSEDPKPIREQADHILTGLRIRTEAEVICPAFCDRSWGDLREAERHSCDSLLMEHAMYTHPFEATTAVTEDDLDWIRENLELIEVLEDNDRFKTSRESLSTYMHAANYRMMAVQLWAGIEAIFEVQHEISYSTSLWAALLLEKRGPRCRQCRNEIKDLYKDRNKAVHGRQIGEDKLKQHVANVRGVLAKLLTKIVERGSMPSHEDFHDLTTMPSELDSPVPCPACDSDCYKSDLFCRSCGGNLDQRQITEKVS